MRTRIRRAIRAVTRPLRKGGLVLLYHRATVVDPDPWRLAVTPAHLAEHLGILARYARPSTADALRDSMAARRIEPGTVLVTFDDGYADLLTEVRPRLDRADVPATMFLVSRAIGRDREFWWDALERALLGPGAPADPLVLSIDGETRSWDVAGAPSRDVVHRDIWGTLRARPPDERDRLAEAALAWARLPLRARPTHRTLTHGELSALAAAPLLEIGAHTANHAWLSGLPAVGQAREIEAGRQELEAMIGRRIHLFAYPYGGPGDVGGAASAVRAAGLTTAFLATGGLVQPSSDPLALPRVFVEDVDGEGFARLLWRHAGIRVA